MGTLHRYLLKETLGTLCLAVGVFTALLLIGSILKDILSLVAAGVLSFGQVARALGLLVPFVLAFALPIGLLTSVILVFGRLSADRELTAARAGGWSLVAISAPILGLGLVLCGVCAWVNCDLAPRCRVAFKILEREAMGFNPKSRNAALVTEGRYVEIDPFTIYARKTWGTPRGTQMEDILVYQLEGGVRLFDAHAQSGELIWDSTAQSYDLIFRNVQGGKALSTNDPQLRPFFNQEISTNRPYNPSTAELKLKYSDMTFAQLWRERSEIRARGGEVAPVVMQLHRQAAFSFACFGFTLLGLPLALRGHRRESNLGIALALLLMAVYYGFLILGQSLVTHPHWRPHLILWIPNLLFIGVGTYLLARADRVGN